MEYLDMQEGESINGWLARVIEEVRVLRNRITLAERIFGKIMQLDMRLDTLEFMLDASVKPAISEKLLDFKLRLEKLEDAQPKRKVQMSEEMMQDAVPVESVQEDIRTPEQKTADAKDNLFQQLNNIYSHLIAFVRDLPIPENIRGYALQNFDQGLMWMDQAIRGLNFEVQQPVGVVNEEASQENASEENAEENAQEV